MQLNSDTNMDSSGKQDEPSSHENEEKSTPQESVAAAEAPTSREDGKDTDQPDLVQKDTFAHPASDKSDRLLCPSKAADFDHRLYEQVVGKLEEMYQSGKLSSSDLDERAIEALRHFHPHTALKILKQFAESSLEHVSNKSAFLCSVMKTYRQRAAEEMIVNVQSEICHVFKGPDEEKIKEILKRTGYTLVVSTGQRQYGGPPPNWDGPPPCKECQVFCGKIPRYMFENELIPLFEPCGTIWELRLMMDPISNTNRGYAFITFTTKEGARESVRQLNGYKISPQSKLFVSVVNPNTRLFIGNIPKDKTAQCIKKQFDRLTDDLQEVIIYSSPDSNNNNRGFCFLEYGTHKAASSAKRRLENGRVKVWNCDIIIDWADPLEEPDDETMSQVKALYVRNLTSGVSEDQLRSIFSSHGHIDRVKKLKDYAFIHFATRTQALRAMENLNNSEINGKTIEVCLAKPRPDKKKKENILKHRELRLQKRLAVFSPTGPSVGHWVGPMYANRGMPRAVVDINNSGVCMRGNQGGGDRGYHWPSMSPGVASWHAEHRHYTSMGHSSTPVQWGALLNSTPISNSYGSTPSTLNDLNGTSLLDDSKGARPKTHCKK